MAFHVFVDGARDRSPPGLARVAAAIGERYGVAARDVETRLARGRFRVKANVDRATAHEYARDLEALGALVSIVDAATDAGVASTGAAPAGTAPASGAARAARPAGSALPAGPSRP